jgi:hypothetical protein
MPRRRQPWPKPKVEAGVDWTADWQKNPKAPIPAGWVWARCLCFAFLIRPPGWRDQVRTYDGRILRTVSATVHVGDICPVCLAPILLIDRRSDPYRWPFVINTPPGRLVPCSCHPVSTPSPLSVPKAREVPSPEPTRKSGWYGPYQPAGRVLASRPGTLTRWSPFPSRGAEAAWVQSRRRQGLPPDPAPSPQSDRLAGAREEPHRA